MSKKYRLLAILLSILFVLSGLGGFLPEQLVAADDQPDLFFSEYVEGLSNNKALEIYNPTQNKVILTGKASIKIYYNGNTTATTINLTGEIEPKGTFIVAHTSAHGDILAKADQKSGSCNFNGNDAIELIYDLLTLDIFGVIGEDPGTGWSGGGVKTVDQTLVRRPHVLAGVKTPVSPFNPSLEWIAYATDTFEHLGSHTIDLYTVFFNLDDKGSFQDEQQSTQQVIKGSSAESPKVIPSNGYSIVGWDKEFKEVTSDIVVNAIFQEWTQPGVFFSEYIMKTGNDGKNKALEIFNGTDETINLEAENYEIRMYFNGATTAALTIALEGIIELGKTFVIAPMGGDFEESADYKVSIGSGWFNGDDAIELTKNGQIVDMIGKIGHDPGDRWEGGGVSTQNSILVRKPQVGQGVTIYGDSNYQNDTFWFDPSLQWTQVDSHSLGHHDCQVIHSVQFLQGDHGTLTGKDYYHVYKGRGLTDRPQVNPHTGY